MASILIIDPDMTTRLRMREALEAANHRCLLAEDAAEAYEIAKHSTRMVTILKTQLSKEVRKEYGEHIRKYLWGDAPFWSSSYFIASTGTTVMEKVKEYIESQRTEEHKRKYVKSGKYSKKKKS